MAERTVKCSINFPTWMDSFGKYDISVNCDFPINHSLLESMSKCMQSEELRLSILDHGLLVWKWFERLHKLQWQGMRIPEALSKNNMYIDIFANIYQLSIIKPYAIYHDCGKPKCLVVDKIGRRHFPHHAIISSAVFSKTFPGENPIISKLIAKDMVFHRKKKQEISQMGMQPKMINTLLCMALAEIHANAQMFGGFQSQSFKIKYKKIATRMKQFFK